MPQASTKSSWLQSSTIFDPLAHDTRSVQKITDRAGQLGHEIQVFLTGAARRLKEVVRRHLSAS